MPERVGGSAGCVHGHEGAVPERGRASLRVYLCRAVAVCVARVPCARESDRGGLGERGGGIRAPEERAAVTVACVVLVESCVSIHAMDRMRIAIGEGARRVRPDESSARGSAVAGACGGRVGEHLS